MYNYIILIDNCFSQCITNNKDSTSSNVNKKSHKIIKCFEKYEYDENVLQNVLEQIPLMIFTLTSLIKFTENVLHKHHDFLRILLYAYIERNNKTRNINGKNSMRMSRLESIIITNFQMKMRLGRFILNYCRSAPE